MQDLLMNLKAKDFPVGTIIEIPQLRLRLRREYGKKPWRQTVGRLRFSHDEVDGSIADGEVIVISLGEQTSAA